MNWVVLVRDPWLQDNTPIISSFGGGRGGDGKELKLWDVFRYNSGNKRVLRYIYVTVRVVLMGLMLCSSIGAKAICLRTTLYLCFSDTLKGWAPWIFFFPFLRAGRLKFFQVNPIRYLVVLRSKELCFGAEYVNPLDLCLAFSDFHRGECIVAFQSRWARDVNSSDSEERGSLGETKRKDGRTKSLVCAGSGRKW